MPAHSVEEYLYAVDGSYRILFSGGYAAQKPALWYLGVKNEEASILPLGATADEQEQIANLVRDAGLTGDQPYQQILLRIYEKGLPTRLTGWSANAFSALKNAVSAQGGDGGVGNPAVWCLGPSVLNRMIGNSRITGIPELLDAAAAELFGSYGTAGVDKPFAVKAGQTALVVFPRKETPPLEELAGSAAYLTKITIPRSACTLIFEQLRRYGL